MSSPEIVIEHTADELAHSVAARAVSTLAAAIRARGRAHLVLTGGSILEATMRAMAEEPAEGAVDWRQVDVWWADERFVPSDSADRNENPARSALLDALPLDPARIHPMPASDNPAGWDLDEAADAYADALAATGSDGPALDVVLLGMGPDGHCASLFPEAPGPRVTGRWIVPVRNSPKPPPERLSFTFDALGAAEQVWVVAAGSGKADAVGLAFSGAGRVQVPVAGARGRDRTLWLLDDEAAAGLPSGLDPRRSA